MFLFEKLYKKTSNGMKKKATSLKPLLLLAYHTARTHFRSMIIFTSTENSMKLFPFSDVLREERVTIAWHPLIKRVAGLLSYYLFKTLYSLAHHFIILLKLRYVIGASKLRYAVGASKLRYVIGASKLRYVIGASKIKVCDWCIKNWGMSLVVYQHWGMRYDNI